MRTLRLVALVIVGVVGVFACTAVGVVTSVAVVQGDQVLAFGSSVQLTATVDASGSASKAVTWSSGDEDVAEVDATGLVTAVGLGEAFITATSVADATKKASIEVTVEPAVVTVAVLEYFGDRNLTRAAADRYTDLNPGVIIEVLDKPELAYDNMLGYYRNVFAAASPELDVVAIDVIWAGELAVHLVDLYPFGGADVVDEHFASSVENSIASDGRLIAVPWYHDAGLLYYRTDLLATYGYDAPPSTWSELAAMAQAIQDGERAAGNPDFWGFVWQGKANEGLTCNALEWIASNAGGRLIEPDGVITVNNANAVAVVDAAAGWVGSISPMAVIDFVAGDAYEAFRSGNVAFMRNWPGSYEGLQADDSPVTHAFDVSRLPVGDAVGAAPAATLGGFQLGVSTYSEHRNVAVDVALFFATYDEQKVLAIERGVPPSIVALYQDDDVLAARPYFEGLYGVFVDAVARPSTVTAEKYAIVSAAISDAVHGVLTGDEDASTALAALEDELVALTGFPTGAP